MLFRILTLFAASTGISAQGWVQPRPWIVRAPITDARILGTLGAADANQIEAAKVAATKGNSKDVRVYAKLMVHDHEASFKENTELAKRFRIARLLPDDSTMARTHKQAMDSLNLLTGAAFDLAFLQATVSDHASLIKQINTSLLPAAERKGIKNFVRGLLPMLSAHQAKGQELLDKQK